MYAVKDEIETIHLYVEREEEKRSYIAFPLLCSLLCLIGIVLVTMYSAQHPYYEHQRLTLPAQFLPPKTFIATVPIIPTGSKTFPATAATGTLSLYNGSDFIQIIPAGFTVTSSTGISVTTDTEATVPAGNPPTYGMTTVTAHAVIRGKIGNIAAYTVNRVEGSSIYIRNLTAFTGGRDAYSVKVVTPQDRQTALLAAQNILRHDTIRSRAVLAYPCTEVVATHSLVVKLVAMCQFVTYHLPSYLHVIGVRIQGKNLFVDVVFVPRPHMLPIR